MKTKIKIVAQYTLVVMMVNVMLFGLIATALPPRDSEKDKIYEINKKRQEQRAEFYRNLQ